MAGEVGDLFAGRDVVQGDDAGVAGGGEEGAGWREGDGADGLDEAFGDERLHGWGRGRGNKY